MCREGVILSPVINREVILHRVQDPECTFLKSAGDWCYIFEGSLGVTYRHDWLVSRTVERDAMAFQAH